MEYDFDFSDRLLAVISRIQKIVSRRIENAFEIENEDLIWAAIQYRTSELMVKGVSPMDQEEFDDLARMRSWSKAGKSLWAMINDEETLPEIRALFLTESVRAAMLPLFMLAPDRSDQRRMGLGVMECGLDRESFCQHLHRTLTREQFSAVRAYVRLGLLADDDLKPWTNYWNNPTKLP